MDILHYQLSYPRNYYITSCPHIPNRNIGSYFCEKCIFFLYNNKKDKILYCDFYKIKMEEDYL